VEYLVFKRDLPPICVKKADSVACSERQWRLDVFCKRGNTALGGDVSFIRHHGVVLIFKPIKKSQCSTYMADA